MGYKWNQVEVKQFFLYLYFFFKLYHLSYFSTKGASLLRLIFINFLLVFFLKSKSYSLWELNFNSRNVQSYMYFTVKIKIKKKKKKKAPLKKESR